MRGLGNPRPSGSIERYRQVWFELRRSPRQVYNRSEGRGIDSEVGRESRVKRRRAAMHAGSTFLPKEVAVKVVVVNSAIQQGGIMVKWEKLDDVSVSIAKEPFSLYWSELKSGSREFEKFLHDPLGEIVDVASGVDKSWCVQTNIIGHEIGFGPDVVSRLALVDPHRKTVFLVLYKHLHPEPLAQ
jgi:hypothetical protein